MDRAEDGRRFPLLTEATMTPRQREAYQGIVSGPRKGLGAPSTPSCAVRTWPTGCSGSASTSASRAPSRRRSTRWPS